MTVQLYHASISTCSQKVRLALAEKGIGFESVILNLRAGDQYDPVYRELNPNAVVPTLVNGGDVIVESTVINEYIDDVFDGPPLRPADPADRAVMRRWAKQLDEGLHAAIVVLSFCIAFRNDFMTKTAAEMASFYTRMNNPGKEKFYQAAIDQGMDFEGFADAVRRYRKQLQDLDNALEGRQWLAGKSYSLADIGFLPYLLRLEHLGLSELWSEQSRVSSWYDRMRQRPNYQLAVTDWLVPQAVAAMQEAGKSAWPRVSKILEN